ncbi:MAG: type II toxin-antitoxin system VapC family toxin [Thermoanaerobaculia bacterium]
MGVLIDSTVLIAYERGRLDLSAKLAQHEDEEFFISVITASEMLHGVHRAQDSKIRTRRSALVEAVLERFPILQVDLSTARIHSRIWADLASAGLIIGPHDLWIAATAIAHGLTLVTANLREFRRVAGLTVEEW